MKIEIKKKLVENCVIKCLWCDREFCGSTENQVESYFRTHAHTKHNKKFMELIQKDS